jgi:hypothetical protein
MKQLFLLSAVLLIVTGLSAFTWASLGPTGVPISKADWFIPAVLSNGHIGLGESGTWTYYTHSNLSVVDFTSYDVNRLMTLLGSGSNSDGVYFFNLHDHSFQLLRWTMNPVFVKYCSEDSMYYVGGMEGLYKTTDGTDWTEVVIPGTGSVTDFAYQGNHFVAAKNGETWWSDNAGATWNQSQSGSMRHGYRFDGHNLYAFMNANSYSDGLWLSTDYADTWSVIEWSLHVSCIGPVFGSNLSFGWLNGENSEIGVGWTVPGGDFILLNEGLPNLNIHCIDMFDLIDTPSFWVGTDDGAYYCTGFLTSTDDQVIAAKPASLRNYPNPFSKSTTIFYDLNKEIQDPRVEIFNIRGEKVFSKKVVAPGSFRWDGCGANGVYFCRIVSQGKTLATKAMVLIK